MKKLILIIFLCLLSICETQAQDVFGSGKNIRKGLSTAVPQLSVGEQFFATDIDVLYIGTSDGSFTTVPLGGSKGFSDASAQAYYYTITTSTALDIDCSKERVIVITDNYTGTTDVNLNNMLEGVLYTLRIHSSDGDYYVNCSGKTGNWADPVLGDIVPSVNATDVFTVYVFGNKIYPNIYGQGY